MLRSILFFCCVLLFNLGCSQSKVTDESTYSKVPLEKQITYILDLTLKTPYEIYINDIKIASNYSRGSNAAIELNPYVLKNGKYKIKLKLFPFWQHKETDINLDEIKNSRILFGYYIKDRETNKVDKYQADYPLVIKSPSNKISSLVQEWEVEIKELPYELEGWSKGQDLRKLDQKQLEITVVEYYKNLWNILNNGEGEKYISLWEKADYELINYDYEYKLNELNNDEIEKIKKYCKNNMIPLDDYEMKIYGDGKLVSLERKNHTMSFNNKSPLDIKGWSPLIRKGQKAGASNYKVKLYLPEGSNEFVIIRK